MTPRFAVERLEDRIAPAGIVTVTFDPVTKSLTIAGDAAENDLSVTQFGNSVAVIPHSGTQVMNGAAGTPGTDALIFKGVRGDLAIDLLGGDDTLQITDLIVARNLTISNTGAGGDTITLSQVKVAGKLTGTGSAGENSLTLDNVAVSGTFSWTGGSQADHYQIGGAAFSAGKDVQFVDSAGDNTFRVTATNFRVAQPFNYTGSVTGTDSVTFETSTFRAGDLNIDTRDGGATVSVHASRAFQVSGGIFVYAGQHLAAPVNVEFDSPVIRFGKQFGVYAAPGVTNFHIKAATLVSPSSLSLNLEGLSGSPSTVLWETGNATLNTLVTGLGDSTDFTMRNTDRVNLSTLALNGGHDISLDARFITARTVIGVFGTNHVSINAALIAKEMTVTLSSKADTFTWNAPAAPGPKSVIGLAYVDLGSFIDGIDSFTIAGSAKSPITFTKTLTINDDSGGVDGDEIHLSGLKVGGLTMSSPNSAFSMTLDNVTAKTATLSSGESLDVAIHGSSFESLVINGGFAADHISIAADLIGGGTAPTLVTRELVIQAGAGADVISLGSSQPFGQAIFRGSALLDGGVDAAPDVLNIGPNAFFRPGFPLVTNFP